MARYVEVAVQLPVRGTYHYSVPSTASALPLVGARVLAPFGNRGVTGVVVREHDQPPEDVDHSKLRQLEALLDVEPIVSEELLELCLWIADYYEAAPGEVIKAALPTGSSVHAKLVVELTEKGERSLAGEGGALCRGHRDVLGALKEAGGVILQKKLLKGRIKLADLEALTDEELICRVSQIGRARVRQKTIRVAHLAKSIESAREPLSRAPKRLEVLEALEGLGGSADIVTLKQLIPRAADHVRALARDGWVDIGTRVVRVDPWAAAHSEATRGMNAPAQPPQLTANQRHAIQHIEASIEQREYAGYLLHGITGSGKTEVYLHSIAHVLDKGRTAIVLVPEISLTPQLAARFRARFGDQVAVLHSGLTDRERYDEWHRLHEGAARIALGARSAIFAPVRDLGIVVVDEEHDSSFKQEEGVRYHARDVALVRAQRASAVCVLGSATPSLESRYGAEQGRLVRLSLPERATPKPLPTVELIDLKDYQPDEGLLTAPLAEAIEEALAAGDQVILFLNRRGFNTFVVCIGCGHAFRCSSCTVSLTYHRGRDRMVCHYCGHFERVPNTCPSCSAEGAIKMRGLGTEKVADAVAKRFPHARVARLDRDVATGAGIQKVLGRVARREVDILVGTQMVTKGHDFPGVTLVGVLLADSALSLPDFRASERTFQLLTQVAGRAGRGDRPGRVLIQSYRVDASAVASARDHDYDRFYQTELEVRRELDYPPFGHLVAVRIDGPDGAAVAVEARRLALRAGAARAQFGSGVTVLGPCEAPLARLKGRTRWHLWLRARGRKQLRHFLRSVVAGEATSGVRVTVDVDPVSTL